MKGLATRLEALVKQTRAPVIILMEGDCWPVRSFPQVMDVIEHKIVREKFVCLGFFLNGRPNKDESEEAKRVRGMTRGPLFYGDCSATGSFPDYGCQMFAVHRNFVPTFVENMKNSVYPHGIDRWFFSSQAMTDDEFAFTSWSLAGQKWGDSDSWGKHNAAVGEVKDPPEREWEHLHIRRFSESLYLQDMRRAIWQRHREHDKNSRK